jgi:hypothetical protein
MLELSANATADLGGEEVKQAVGACFMVLLLLFRRNAEEEQRNLNEEYLQNQSKI